MPIVIVDANVLIDYVKSDRTVLEMFARLSPRLELRSVASTAAGHSMAIRRVTTPVSPPTKLRCAYHACQRHP